MFNPLQNMVAKSSPVIPNTSQYSSGNSWFLGDNTSALTVDTADQQVSVFACCRVLAESIGSLNLETYEKIGKNSEKAKDFSLYNILYIQPNPLMTSTYYIEKIVYDININGNHFSQIIRNRKGEVTALYPLDPKNMKVAFSADGTKKLYEYTLSQYKKQSFRDNEILHVAGIPDHENYALGISPIAKNMKTINAVNAVDNFGSGFFERGATASGAFSTTGELGDDAYKRLKQDLADNYTGMANSSKPLLLESGLTFSPISISNDQAQFLESKKYGRQEVSSIFRVPLHMIGDLDGATFSNIEQQSLDFVKFTLLPIITKIENSITLSLLSESERDKYFIRFNLGVLLRGDFKTRVESYRTLSGIGVLSINEIRELEEWNGIEGGDIHRTQMQYVDINKIDDQLDIK